MFPWSVGRLGRDENTPASDPVFGRGAGPDERRGVRNAAMGQFTNGADDPTGVQMGHLTPIRRRGGRTLQCVMRGTGSLPVLISAARHASQETERPREWSCVLSTT